MIGTGGFQDSVDFLNLISFGIAFQSPLPQHVVAEQNREPIGALKFILNNFVDKKQVPILNFQAKVMKTNLSIDSEQKLRQVLEG
jgi:uncharacterized membrane protein